MTRDVKWVKSSRSGGGNENCVELAPGLVRDSKNPDGPILTVDLFPLLDAVRAGWFDLN